MITSGLSGFLFFKQTRSFYLAYNLCNIQVTFPTYLNWKFWLMVISFDRIFWILLMFESKLHETEIDYLLHFLNFNNVMWQLHRIEKILPNDHESKFWVLINQKSDLKAGYVSYSLYDIGLFWILIKGLCDWAFQSYICRCFLSGSRAPAFDNITLTENLLLIFF